ncbi:MAG TPA: DUF2442 domain-containing protein [Thermoanaerobaculia bacterium]|nr:DUF2442 domain-containing protein [Thermoanaerobaculia bacterium]
MTTSAIETDERAVDVAVTESDLVVRIADGRTISVPLAWFPRLLAASPAERRNVEVVGDGVGLHWPGLDEDLSVAGFLRGEPSVSPRPARVLSTSQKGTEALISAVMSEPPDAGEARRRFHATLAALERGVQQFVCPIYGVHGDDGTPVGSGFLLQLREKLILVTAAHVLHARHQFNLQMLGQTRIVPFGGVAYSTGPLQDHGSSDFEHDIAFLVLDTAAMLEPPGTPPLLPSDLDVGDLPTGQTAYGFVGFPGSENRALPGFKFQRTTVFYGGQAAGRDKYERLGYDTRTHFVMSFERERMIDHSGQIVAVPEPYGMSGGPVFKLGTFEEIDNQTARPRVIALTIEWWQRLEVLVGVRMALLTETIRQVLPDDAADLPHSPYVRTSVAVNEI